MSETVSWADRVRGGGMRGRSGRVSGCGVCVWAGGGGGLAYRVRLLRTAGGRRRRPFSSSEDTHGDAVRSRAEDPLP